MEDKFRTQRIGEFNTSERDIHSARYFTSQAETTLPTNCKSLENAPLAQRMPARSLLKP